MRSPSLTNGGTVTVTPFSSVAGLFTFETVAPFMVGSVRVTVNSIEGGRSIPIGDLRKTRPESSVRELAIGRRRPTLLRSSATLLVIFGIHEMVMRPIGIHILHFMLFQRCPFDGIGRAEAMFERGAGFDVSELRLHHRAQVAGRVVAKFHDFAQLAIEKNYHPAPNLSCRDSHKILTCLRIKMVFDYRTDASRHGERSGLFAKRVV